MNVDTLSCLGCCRFVHAGLCLSVCVAPYFHLLTIFAYLARWCVTSSASLTLCGRVRPAMCGKDCPSGWSSFLTVEQ